MKRRSDRGRRGAGRLFREAFDTHPTPSLLVSRRGALLAANAAAEELLGLSADRWLLRPVEELPRVGRQLATLVARAVADRGSAMATVDPGPGSDPVQAMAAPLLAPGSVRAVILRLRELPSPLDLEALAAGLAHEIKNPLAGLKGAAELLAGELAEDSPLQAYTRLIAREAARVDGLVRSLLDLTRPLVLHQAPANLHEICDDVLLLARSQLPPGVVFERRYDPSLPEISVDRDAIVQVLLNLVRNAAEAMEGRRGTIVLETGIAPGMRVRIGETVRRLARVAVIDQGPGLPEGIQLFTPFATTRPKGTGLGLVVSRRIAEAHGGRLELRNRREEEGAEAELLLPG